MHICRLPSFLCTKRMEAPYVLALRWNQQRSRYVSSCLCTSAYSAGDKWYCLGLGGWPSVSSKVISYVMWFEGGRQAPRTHPQTSPTKQKSMDH